jgi:hypothetical protein
MLASEIPRGAQMFSSSSSIQIIRQIVKKPHTFIALLFDVNNIKILFCNLIIYC